MILNDANISFESEIDDTITYSNDVLDGDALDSIIREIKRKDSVSIIKLCFCSLNSHSLEKIMDAIEDRSFIFDVNLSGNILNENIIDALFKEKLQISRLTLSQCDINDVLIQRIIPNISMISTLVLSHNHITSNGARLLLKELNDLHSLDLSYNYINDDIAQFLSPQLKSLYMAGNNFSSNGVDLIIDKISETNITKLNLNSTAAIQIPTLKKIVNIKKLKRVFLNNCGITKFVDIPQSSNLRILDIQGSPVERFNYPSSLTVIGDFVTKDLKPEIDFDSFNEIVKQMNDLKNAKQFDASKEISELNSCLSSLKKRIKKVRAKSSIKPSMQSLSKYAAKSEEFVPIYEFLSNLIGTNGHPINDSQSTLMRVKIAFGLFSFIEELKSKNLYLSEFNPSEFIITDDSKVLITTAKHITSVYKDISDQIQKYIVTNINSFANIQLSYQLRPPSVYEIDRSAESIINLFHQLNESQLMERFHLKIRGESAVDHGGVTRDVLTEFWNSNEINLFESSDNSLSLLPNTKSKIDFISIGKILAKCYIESIPVCLNLHSLIFRYITDQMPLTKAAWAEMVTEYDPQVAINLNYDNPSDSEFIERSKEIFERFDSGLTSLSKGFCFVPSVKYAVQNLTDWWDLRSAVVGNTEVSGKDLMKDVRFVGFSSSRMPKLWERLILEMDSKEIRRFVRFVTGLSGIPHGGFERRGKRIIITASDRLFSHTCTFELESPRYKDYEEMRGAISVALAAMEIDPSLHESYEI